MPSATKTTKSFNQVPKDRAHAARKGDPTTKREGRGAYAWGSLEDDVKYMEEKFDFGEEDENKNVILVPADQFAQAKFVSSAEDLNQYKKAIKDALREHVANADHAAFATVVRDLDMTIYHQELPKMIIIFGLDLSSPQRDSLNQLLLHLFTEDFITTSQFKKGIQKVFFNVDDLLLDNPRALELIQEFTDFAIANNLVKIEDVMLMEEEVQFLKQEDKVSAAKARISTIFDEFQVSGDIPDACRQINELKAPHLGFEVVKRFVSSSFGRTDGVRECVSRFLAAAAGSTISQDQVEKGFSLLLARTEDLVLDSPNVLSLLAFFLARAVSDEVLPPAFVVRVDLGSQDMGFQCVQQAARLLRERNSADSLSDWAPRLRASSE